MRLFSPAVYDTYIHHDIDLQLTHSYFTTLCETYLGYMPTWHLLPVSDHSQVCQTAQQLSLETSPASFSRDTYSYLLLPSFVFLGQ